MVRATPPVVPCSTFLFKFGGDASASFVQKAAKCRMLLGSCGMIRFWGSGKGPPTSGSRSPVGRLVGFGTIQTVGGFLGISEP